MLEALRLENLMLESLKEASGAYYSMLAKSDAPDVAIQRQQGSFYTHFAVCHQMLEELAKVFRPNKQVITLADPFVGDGRLLSCFLEHYAPQLTHTVVIIYMSDIDPNALDTAKKNVAASAKKNHVACKIYAEPGDTFVIFQNLFNRIDCCLTNPPWLLLKPPKKNLFSSVTASAEFLHALEKYEKAIRSVFIQSQPVKTFGRWGINLARVGLELAFRLLKDDGVCAIVSPASLVSDQVSKPLRKWLFNNYSVTDIDYYVPEAKLYGIADVASITLIGKKGQNTKSVRIRKFDSKLKCVERYIDENEFRFVSRNDYVVPLETNSETISILQDIESFPQLKDHSEFSGLVTGREIDETRINEKLSQNGEHLFLKGYMVSRFNFAADTEKYVNADKVVIPPSVHKSRIVWRDVSRMSQARRIIATIIPPGLVTGNSLGMAYFPEENDYKLKVLLGIISSFVFEFQVRLLLTTNHVSAGILKLARIPRIPEHTTRQIVAIVEGLLNQKDDQAAASLQEELECTVALLYNLSQEQFSSLLSVFHLPDEMKQAHLQRFKQIESGRRSIVIPNHYAAKLSELDMEILSHVPQGGNWKNIPESVPSQRLVQIRESYKAGKGSRSTYYGRLRPDRPAYTINTYFSRPGNGCNAHYAQERTISQREAARFQSFPDSFVFHGSKGAIDKQIGNAVPPLLAFQLARSLPVKGMFIDLFCGAGGLGLGFCWAGWRPIIANDIDKYSIVTHAANIREEAFVGDINDEKTIARIVQAGKQARTLHPNLPLFVLGGPPCQGFSTANCGRSARDQRNWLFKAYIHVVTLLRPEGFLFENVRGILNLEGGTFFQLIKHELGKVAESISVLQVNSARFGIPQRRERVIIVGGSIDVVKHCTPTEITSPPAKYDLPEIGLLFPQQHLTPTAEEAISDLPPIQQGQDGSTLNYLCPPQSAYQQLMRGVITPQEYIASFQ